MSACALTKSRFVNIIDLSYKVWAIYMAKTKVQFRNSLTLNIVIITTILLITFGVIVATVGYTRFNDMLLERYNSEALTTAQSSLAFVNTDNIAKYLQYSKKITGEEEIGAGESDIQALKDEFDKSNKQLQKFCETEDVAILYYIVPNKDNYSEYYSVFNCPNSKYVPYSAWALGSKQVHKSPNDYDRIYRDIMEGTKETDAVVRKTNENGGLPHINSLTAVKDSNGNVVAIAVVQHTMSLLRYWNTSYVVLIVITTVVLAALSVVVFALIIRRQFVLPIHRIRDEAQRFAKENSEPETPLDGSMSKIHEISTLAEAIGNMETDTLKYIKHLSQASAEKQKIVSELGIAQAIQKASLNSQFPAFPDRTEFDLYASMNAAKEVGGDFYDFLLVDDDHLALTIADVSGKGVPAALFMMVTKILLSERALTGNDPAKILEIVNKRICAKNSMEMFVTVWLGILEISTGKVIASNAGHDNPLVMKNGRFEFFKAKRGIVIGAMEDAKYSNYTFSLEKGDKLFLYTDGVPEATNRDGQMFTLERMQEFVNTMATNTPKEIIDGVSQILDKFVDGAPQFDDITMLCVEYNGKECKHEKVLTIGADINNLPEVNSFVESFLESNDVAPKATHQVLLALEEVFANVAHYAYPPNGGTVKITERINDGMLTLIFADYGVPYNPLEKEDPDFSLSLEERKEGGLGIYMTKKLVDNITYNHVDNQNILTLEKKL